MGLRSSAPAVASSVNPAWATVGPLCRGPQSRHRGSEGGSSRSPRFLAALPSASLCRPAWAASRNRRSFHGVMACPRAAGAARGSSQRPNQTACLAGTLRPGPYSPALALPLSDTPSPRCRRRAQGAPPGPQRARSAHLWSVPGPVSPAPPRPPSTSREALARRLPVATDPGRACARA
jgi:hypothetical protein